MASFVSCRIWIFSFSLKRIDTVCVLKLLADIYTILWSIKVFLVTSFPLPSIYWTINRFFFFPMGMALENILQIKESISLVPACVRDWHCQWWVRWTGVGFIHKDLIAQPGSQDVSRWLWKVTNQESWITGVFRKIFPNVGTCKLSSAGTGQVMCGRGMLSS